ncbi:hypothetical protein H310_00446 [Aphanomyces invadans]|uniref:Uncharacterized protein n=1 Tax=Aphanomyces invadans TaxID=157072 RepID=A0A024UWL8_9STRA|nr:hypothetical protein H310_00446 [Aphanomyces invadans]ETW10058.1 hypothetical protein H310_00446 [Aphanomyces invadans]|eukprot:XP_008861469.1 hypothetical protein H310_00446 [Aphanomyces invadans]
MPVLLRRSAPTFTVEELADGYSRNRRVTSRSEQGSSRRISAPEDVRAHDPPQSRTPSRSEPPEYARAPSEDNGNFVGACDDDIKPRTKPKTLANIVHHPNMMSTLANELNRLPKTYARLCWDRITSSFASVRSTRQKKSKVSSDTDIATTGTSEARTSSIPSSPTTSEASNSSLRFQFSPQA